MRISYPHRGPPVCYSPFQTPDSKFVTSEDLGGFILRSDVLLTDILTWVKRVCTVDLSIFKTFVQVGQNPVKLKHPFDGTIFWRLHSFCGRFEKRLQYLA